MMDGNSRRLTAEQRIELDALSDLPDEQIDTTDMPEVRNWASARRGAFYRPVKEQLTSRCATTCAGMPEPANRAKTSS